MLDSLKVDRDHIAVMVNGHDAHAVYDAASIERNLKFPIRVQLPSEPRLVGGSIHRGTPLLVTNPESDIAELFKGFARTLAPAAAGPVEEVKLAAKTASPRRFSLRR